MAINLKQINQYEYNQESEKELLKAIQNNRTAICTNCVGSGKSYLIGQVIQKFKNPLLISPRKIISKKLIDEFNVHYMTYTKFRSGANLSQFDCIIFDEVHHVGSKLAIKELEKLKNDRVYYLGFSATPQRTRDIDVSKMFDVKINKITFSEAITKSIFTKPIYKYGYFAEIDNSANRKFKLRAKLNGITATQRIKQHLASCNKILIFAKDNETMEKAFEELEPTLKEMGFICGMYSIKHNNNKFYDRYESSKEKMALFNIDKVDEGIHIDDVDGLVLLRHTSSDRLMAQWIGRITHFFNNNEKRPIILDLAINHHILRTEVSKHIQYEIGALRGFNKDFIGLLREIKELDFDIAEFDIWGDLTKYTYNGQSIYLSQLCRIKNIDNKSFNSYVVNRNIVDITDEVIDEYKKSNSQFHKHMDIKKRRELYKYYGINQKRIEDYASHNNAVITSEYIKWYYEQFILKEKQIISIKAKLETNGYTLKQYSSWCGKHKKNKHNSIDEFLENYKILDERYNVMIYGKEYNSLKECCKEYNSNYKRVSMYHNRYGMSYEDAIKKSNEYDLISKK